MIPKEVKLRGIGISNAKARLIKHTDDNRVAMFLRNDGYFEVGIVKYAKRDYTFPNGSQIKAGDFSYWNNEDFGSIASTSKSRDKADTLYQIYVDKVEAV